MKTSEKIEFPDEIQTARWRKEYAETYCRTLKETAKEYGQLNDPTMQAKIRAAEADAAEAARQFEYVIGSM